MLFGCVFQQVADMGSSISSIQQQMKDVTSQLSALQAGLQVCRLSVHYVFLSEFEDVNMSLFIRYFN